MADVTEKRNLGFYLNSRFLFSTVYFVSLLFNIVGFRFCRLKLNNILYSAFQNQTELVNGSCAYGLSSLHASEGV